MPRGFGGGHGHGGYRNISEKPKDFTHWKAFKRTLPHLWPKGEWRVKIRVIISVLLVGAQKLVELATPFLLAQAILYLTPPDISLPIYFIIAYGGVRFVSDALGSARQMVFARVAAQMERRVALEIFVHLQQLSLSYHLDRKTGSVLRSVSRGASSFATVLGIVLFQFAPVIIQVFVVCGYLLEQYMWTYSVITFATIILYIIYSLGTTEWRNKFRRKMNEKDNDFNQKAVDALLNFETVKYFNAEEHEAKRYDDALVQYREANITSQQSLALLNGGQALLISIGVVGVMFLSAKEVVDGTMHVADFVLIQGFILTLFRPLGMLGTFYRVIKQNLIDVENMFEILNQKIDVEDEPNAPALYVSKAHIKFDKVRFSYGNGVPVLKNISFEVQPGERVAIVGPSGAGKSTISRLLYRFYDVTGGQITIDGRDIREVTQRSLRREIGIVPQECVLFNDTVGYNIGYGIFGSGANRTASHEEIRAAARAAQLDVFIDKQKEGYDRAVGERGLRLSGGEKQRVAIARAVLKAPKIMVFDEATSSLDSRTEQGILSQLDALSQGRSSITIAHRLSTIVNSDRIIVLKNGLIAEQGTHHQLLDLGGEYKAMWDMQQASQKLEEEMEFLKDLQRQQSHGNDDNDGTTANGTKDISILNSIRTTSATATTTHQHQHHAIDIPPPDRNSNGVGGGISTRVTGSINDNGNGISSIELDNVVDHHHHQNNSTAAAAAARSSRSSSDPHRNNNNGGYGASSIESGTDADVLSQPQQPPVPDYSAVVDTADDIRRHRLDSDGSFYHPSNAETGASSRALGTGPHSRRVRTRSQGDSIDTPLLLDDQK